MGRAGTKGADDLGHARREAEDSLDGLGSLLEPGIRNRFAPVLQSTDRILSYRVASNPVAYFSAIQPKSLPIEVYVEGPWGGTGVEQSY